ncbi:hypothetical protein THMIRHAT_04810 [Thiosulfativibrio zosterae]|uniref:Uncharacterized protein n=1 Tax=Thiosulfativibrio zosterae TaxID=2675053 RepID=A0A6F8PKW3_9GAMM|nr:hypothetical protein THMIRHAT_04810 [Thiosulfativibrio zosterae]
MILVNGEEFRRLIEINGDLEDHTLGENVYQNISKQLDWMKKKPVKLAFFGLTQQLERQDDPPTQHMP